MLQQHNQNSENPLVLIVEDDPVTRLTLEKVLQKVGYQTQSAENGSEGFSSFIKQKPDIILMDVMMPVMGGYEAVQAIRNYEMGNTVPILMLTALDDNESIDLAFESGATDFITKPLNFGLLSQRVKYALRAAALEDKLRTSQAQLQYAQQLAKLGYWTWNLEQDAISGSQSVFELFAIPQQSHVTFEQFLRNVTRKDKPLIYQAVAELSASQPDIQISFRVVQHDSSLSHIECLGEANFDKQGKLVSITGTAQDISRLHKAELLIQYQSEHDRLTELPNRNNFSKTLEKIVDLVPEDKLAAVIVFDIDRFKQINETLGQEYGDNLLLTIAQRLNRITRENDYVARLGSDEFAIFLQNVGNQSDLNILINRFYQQLSAPFVIEGKELYVSYSFGVATYPDDSKEAETLVNLANIARTKAKKSGGNQFVFFKPEMNENAQDTLSLENDLRKALKNHEIEVYYQPQVRVKDEYPSGAEALVRWNHPTRGLISPGIFIPLAESTGLILEIGAYVLQTAIKTAEKWHQAGYPLHIGVNLSGRQFVQSNLMADIQHLITHTSLDPHFIDLEITESLAMSNAKKNIQTLKGLKALGMTISIDDFGTGYSSLAYLQSFPINTIKIDRSFILNLGTKEGQAITRTILAMAESLDLEVVAEGIEEDAHVEFFKDKHCHIFQGYKYGKPMPEKAFFKWLTTYNND